MDDVEKTESGASSEAQRHRLRGLAALKLHATLVTGLAVCAVAFWFELGRAEGGNSLSWAYVFEWPLLAAFAIYMWWKFLHPGEGRERSPKKSRPAIAPEYEGMLAGWQEHQRALAAEQAESSPPPGAPNEGSDPSA